MKTGTGTLLSRVVGPLVAAGLIFLCFFVGLGVWSANAPLTSAAIAPGTVGIESRRKVVQHLEGGIIAEILAEEGDRVAAGDLLIRLDQTVARSTLDLLQGQFIDLLATRARLVAEREESDRLIVPEALKALADDPRVIRALASEREVFLSRKEAYSSRLAILQSKVDKLREQIKGFDAQSVALKRQIQLIRLELGSVEQMVDKGLERAPRLYRVQRDEASIEGSLGEIAARRSEAEVLIGETELAILDFRAQTRNRITGELNQIDSRIADMRPRLRAAEDKLARTMIRAPVDGTVVALAHHTVGGVIGAGRPILDIVPTDMAMLVEARMSPADIDVVRVGLPSEIRFTAFSARTTPTVAGEVVHVSADRLIDQSTGESYYVAHVRPDFEVLENSDLAFDPSELYPGMPVEVMVITGRRSVMNYFLQQVTDVLSRAFREG